MRFTAVDQDRQLPALLQRQHSPACFDASRRHTYTDVCTHAHAYAHLCGRPKNIKNLGDIERVRRVIRNAASLSDRYF